MENFINVGWSAGGQADAAAKSGDKGASVVGTALEITPGVRPYQLTESGLALALALAKRTREWMVGIPALGYWYWNENRLAFQDR